MSKKMYNYFYNRTPITKDNFAMYVPENWESELVNGEYSWGYYRASEVEEED